VVDNTLNLNGGNGALMAGSWDSLYVLNNVSAGNPHFTSVTAQNAVNESFSRSIFESNSPDLVDTGDCVLAISTFASSGLKFSIKNCIVLRNPTTGVTSGQMLTSFNPPASALTHKLELFHNTMNQNKTSVGGVGQRACVAYAEGAVGVADQISALKSNLGWATATGNGYLAERISGTVDGHITATGADFNWLWNIDAGDNGRGYRDRANSPAQDLWAAGNADGNDASDAGVDNHQGSGDPGFIDNTRCMATWAVARGYGTTQADAVAAIKTDRTRIPDLFDYVFQGFKCTNASMRTAGHDGGCPGAANYDRSRSLAAITASRSALATKYAGASFSS
jgi:hypothetical protein